MPAKNILVAALLVVAGAGNAHATTEICGNAVDDDGNGMVDEGCAPALTTGVCESPLSCGDTGMVSWSTGALHYDLPPDIAPRVPYGPGIGFRRFYTSMYTPPVAGVPNNNAKPMGANWQHTYMTWVTPGATNQLILHTSQGRDVLFVGGATVGGWKTYKAQAGYHVLSFKQNTVSPFQIQEQFLTGETITYNSSGQLTTITDLVGNSVAVTVDANGSTSTVTDASGGRRLLFAYSGTTLHNVVFQLLISGTWTTKHNTTLSYTGALPTSANIGSALSQQYGYTGGYLTSVTDATGLPIASFAYSSTINGRIDRVDTPRGSLGFDYGSTRTGCAAGGQTLLLFNKANATVCNTDTDCGTGAMCGGKTATGATGACYQAARCLTLGTSSAESVVTAIAPIGAGGGACSGACADVMAYVWSATSGVIATAGVEDAVGRYKSALYNASGLPTTIVEGDTDSNASTVPAGARVTYLYYDTTYPGRLKETRHQSDLDTANVCSSTLSVTAGCARAVNTYKAAAPYLLDYASKIGTTLTATASLTPFTYNTYYHYDSLGRLQELDGPTGSKTVYTYYTSTDPTTNGFLNFLDRYTTATTYLRQLIASYDFFGHPTAVQDANNVWRCDTYDASRGYLTQTRTGMVGAKNCTTVDPADLTTNWLRDSALRLTKLQRPDGSCVLDTYGADGRLSQVLRRDDCLTSSAGDSEQYVYSADGLVTEIDTYDSASTLTRQQLYSYANGRQLQEVINPVNTTYFTGLVYDASGLLKEVDGENALGKTTYTYGPGNDTRVTNETHYYSSTGSDAWSFLYGFDGDQSSYTDQDGTSGLTLTSKRDDAGREVQRLSPDFPSGISTVIVYDADGNVTTKIDDLGTTYPRTSNYTYDLLDRRLTLTYPDTHVPGVCNTSAFTTWSYDSVASCPAMAASCGNLAGHLATVTTSLMCSSIYADNSLDQQTYYGYDPAGRPVSEYISDDTGHATVQQATYTKNGALSQTTLPSGATLSATFGSTGNNSDTDRITSLQRSGTTVIDTASWFPFGPLKQYNHENTSSFGTLERTRISRNKAYRVTDIRTETQDAAHEIFGVAITEDAKGRVTARDYADNSYGVQDSYFLYDNEDHLACETTTSVSSCPITAGATVKNSHYLSPPFTHAGDWQKLLRPIPNGTPGVMDNNFTITANTHQISSVDQPSSGLGTTYFTYDSRGDRSSDYSSVNTHAERDYTYDPRGNVINVRGQLYTGSAWHYYDVQSAFDAHNRRVYKGIYDETTLKTATWYYYYDSTGRLVEIKTYPDSSAIGTLTVYQLVWLGNRMVLYWQMDYPTATTSRRYTGTDEAGRVADMQSWPATGGATRVWALSPSAWGYDQVLVGGGSVLQPLLFPGQYIDDETKTYTTSAVAARPGLVLNGFRTYDPFTGGYLQVDPRVPSTQSSYVYADSSPVSEVDPSGLIGMGGDLGGNSGYGFGTCQFPPCECSPDDATTCIGQLNWSITVCDTSTLAGAGIGASDPNDDYALCVSDAWAGFSRCVSRCDEISMIQHERGRWTSPVTPVNATAPVGR